MKRFLFRCDAAAEVGMGHLSRCLTLGQELKSQGAQVIFACRTVEGAPLKLNVDSVVDDWVSLDWNLNRLGDLEQVVCLHKKHRIDVVIVDHYRANLDYQLRMRKEGIRWLQFDDFRRQPLWANWIINTNPLAEEVGYEDITQEKNAVLLLGSKFALLRPEFRNLRAKVNFRKHAGKVLLTFGGGSDLGATIFSLEAIKSDFPDIERIIMTSRNNPFVSQIKQWMQEHPDVPTQLHIDEPNVADVMAEADIAITAGGVTTFETAALGLPALIIQIADNQRPNAVAWQKCGVSCNMGSLNQLGADDLRNQFLKLVQDTERRKSMAETGKKWVDGRGAQRVVENLLFNHVSCR